MYCIQDPQTVPTCLKVILEDKNQPNSWKWSQILLTHRFMVFPFVTGITNSLFHNRIKELLLNTVHKAKLSETSAFVAWVEKTQTGFAHVCSKFLFVLIFFFLPFGSHSPVSFHLWWQKCTGYIEYSSSWGIMLYYDLYRACLMTGYALVLLIHQSAFKSPPQVLESGSCDPYS